MSDEVSEDDPNNGKAADDVLRDVEDPVTLAVIARMACARIANHASNDGPHATGPDQLQLLTELVHTVRMVREAAESTSGRSDEMVADLSWRFAGANRQSTHQRTPARTPRRAPAMNRL